MSKQKLCIIVALVVIALCCVFLVKGEKKLPAINLHPESSHLDPVLTTKLLSNRAVSTPLPLLNQLPTKSNDALVQARKDFPTASEQELESAVRQGLDLKMVKEERVPEIRILLVSLKVALQQYRAQYGGYPQGDNAMITKALMGDNPKNIIFFEPPQKRVTPTNSLLDPWGTPFNMQIDGSTIKIRSAGPNRLFWDADDQFMN